MFYSKMASHKCTIRCVRWSLIICALLVVIGVVQFYQEITEYEEEQWEDGTWHEVTHQPQLDLHGDEESAALRRAAEAEVIPHPILIWWTRFTGEQGAVKVCPADHGDVRCFLTVDRHYRNHNSTTAFLFYGTDYSRGDLPVPRQPHHEWGLFHEESPKNNYLFSHAETLELFNHTATFRRTSDYPITTQHLADLASLETTQYLVSTEEKTRLLHGSDGLALVAYVQSDCGTPSDRDNFVRMLQRHIKVDSYGKCEHNRDLPKHLIDPIAGMEHTDFYRHLARYKFVLALENAVCDDYITEKFWRPFIVGSVPVVYGSPRARDYLPDPHSAIFLEDFSTVEELVALLLHLNASTSEYDAYLSYKHTGVTNNRLRREVDTRGWGINDYNTINFIEGFECHVCRKIHENKHRLSKGMQPLQHRATMEHYGCPKPNKFSDVPKGSLTLVENTWWFGSYQDDGFSAKAVKELMHTGKAFGDKDVDDLVYQMKNAYHEH